MSDAGTPTKADIDAAHNIICAGPGNASKACGIAARHRLAAEATQAAEIARLRKAVRLACVAGENLAAEIDASDAEFDVEDQAVIEAAKDDLIAARAALSPQPTAPEVQS